MNVGKSSKQPILLSLVIYLMSISLAVLSGLTYTEHETAGIIRLENINISIYTILENNIRALLLLFSGAVLLAIPTMTELVFNGIMLGHLIMQAKEYGDLRLLLLLTLPHGIFEIPAIIIAGAAGFKIPYEIVRYLAGKKEQILTKEDIKEYLTLALISIILIVIASWIEANVTLKIAKAMLNSTKGI